MPSACTNLGLSFFCLVLASKAAQVQSSGRRCRVQQDGTRVRKPQRTSDLGQVGTSGQCAPQPLLKKARLGAVLVVVFWRTLKHLEAKTLIREQLAYDGCHHARLDSGRHIHMKHHEALTPTVRFIAPSTAAFGLLEVCMLRSWFPCCPSSPSFCFRSGLSDRNADP